MIVKLKTTKLSCEENKNAKILRTNIRKQEHHPAQENLNKQLNSVGILYIQGNMTKIDTHVEDMTELKERNTLPLWT